MSRKAPTPPPPGAKKPPPPPTPPRRAAAEQDREKQNRCLRRGDVLVPLSLPAADRELIAARDFSRDEIATARGYLGTLAQDAL